MGLSGCSLALAVLLRPPVGFSTTAGATEPERGGPRRVWVLLRQPKFRRAFYESSRDVARKVSEIPGSILALKPRSSAESRARAVLLGTLAPGAPPRRQDFAGSFPSCGKFAVKAGWVKMASAAAVTFEPIS